MRPDKVILAAVAATLALYRAGVATREIPVWRQLATPVDVLESRATAIVGRVPGTRVVAVRSTVGGGSLPGETLESRAVAVAGASPDRLLARLRAGTPAVVGRIEDGEVILDLRAVEPADDEALVGALTAALLPARRHG
jgi:L-seryl-tRNA(Ser) seleniumtransferase